MQTTIKTQVTLTGTGLHSGRPSRVTLRPAKTDHGIRFRRTDIAGRDPFVPAVWSSVVAAPLCTRIENQDGVSVSTIEHLMAALAGCGIWNVLIEVEGPEVPILDGSSAPFVDAILAAGILRQGAPLRAIRVVETVEVRRGDAWARLDPADTLQIDFVIDFPDAAIGRQEKRLSLANGAFVHELCDSRTFCRQADVEAMHAQGQALGGTYENAVVVDGGRVLSPGGLRHDDEAVRHKMLDALGDLALAGAPLLARYTGHKAGHALTNELLRALFDRPEARRLVLCDATTAARLPGAGVTREDLTLVA